MKNLERLWNNANSEQISNSINWYDNALLNCISISKCYDLDLVTVVGMAAALSPRNKWNRNLKDVCLLIENPFLKTKCCTFKSNVSKALNILSYNGYIEDRDILNILKGPKTKSFYLNIIGNSNVVTVDVWAYRSLSLRSSPKNYQIAQAKYREFSLKKGLEPKQVQAVIWEQIRREYNVKS